MSTTNDIHSTRIVCYAAHQPGRQPLPDVDPILVERKGHFYLLASADTPDEVVAAAQRRYYDDPRFDRLPSAAAVLWDVMAAWPAAADWLVAAIIVQDLDVWLVGTADAALWLRRLGPCRELFAPGHTPERYRALDFSGTAAPPPDLPALYGTQWRLTTGDVLIAGRWSQVGAVDPVALDRLVQRTVPAHLPGAVARATGAPRSAPAPIWAMTVPGFRPMAFVGALAPDENAPAPQPDRLGMPRRLSPIWIALVFAILVIGVVWYVERPQITLSEAGDMLKSFLLDPTPGAAASGSAGVDVGAATRVSQATPTPEPTATTPAAEPVPKLLAPWENQTLFETAPVLQWSWSGTLADDEAFDVRLWRLGAPEESLGLTRDLSYTAPISDAGWYSWTVVVVRASGETVIETLSAEPESIAFRWQP